MNDSQPRVHVPNFDLMTQHLQGFTDEFKHCRNLSAVESTTTLLAAINGLKTQMEQLSAQFSVQIGEVKQEVGDLKQEVGDIKRDLGSLNRRMTNSDRNNVIRLENSGEKNANDVIRPLVNLETGEEIAGFPASISDLDRLRRELFWI
ncbi:hypothetical protein N0V84_004971 [Fusarium piperis]|uniref:Uncharacterized protein n=1 Tax=Fusarium piperis TaxID=1435070 RepID=A0A9W8WEK4_9HYPO|nr:hypothetical protein N0V84_004971 [Fusarium piperis]